MVSSQVKIVTCETSSCSSCCSASDAGLSTPCLRTPLCHQTRRSMCPRTVVLTSRTILEQSPKTEAATPIRSMEQRPMERRRSTAPSQTPARTRSVREPRRRRNSEPSRPINRRVTGSRTALHASGETCNLLPRTTAAYRGLQPSARHRPIPRTTTSATATNAHEVS